MYLTARSYLLAGFTAASIVAATTIPFAPRSAVHVPDIHTADVALATAESKIAVTVRTLRAVEAQAMASAVTGAATAVAPEPTRRASATTISQQAPSQSAPNALSPSTSSTSSGVPTATTHQATQQSSAPAPTVTAPASAVDPVAGDLLALTFDLAGTPAVVINNLSFVADAAIATLTGATAGAVPSDLALAQRLNHISADLTNLSDAIRHLVFRSRVGDSGAGTPSGVNTGSAATSASGAATPAAKGGPDIFALGPLIGDVAITGVDMVATPFALTQTLTRALAVEVTDIGAGQMQEAQQAADNILHNGVMQLQTRISDDEKNIGAALARLTGMTRSTTNQTGTVKSVPGTANAVSAAKPASTSAAGPRSTHFGPGPVLTKPTSSAPAAEAASADHKSGAAHKPKTAGTATAASTSGQKGSPHDPGSTTKPAKQGGNNTAGATKSATQSTTTSGQPTTKAGTGANGTSTTKHSASSPAHKDGGKHRKH